MPENQSSLDQSAVWKPLGVGLDETNGRMILIGEGQRPINLPPLRLDDVVTVFRSVYKHGEAPSVSIDPISNSDSETLMTVRHGPATVNTYVGWVLYEADRPGPVNRHFSLGPGEVGLLRCDRIIELL